MVGSGGHWGAGAWALPLCLSWWWSPFWALLPVFFFLDYRVLRGLRCLGMVVPLGIAWVVALSSFVWPWSDDGGTSKIWRYRGFGSQGRIHSSSGFGLKMASRSSCLDPRWRFLSFPQACIKRNSFSGPVSVISKQAFQLSSLTL